MELGEIKQERQVSVDMGLIDEIDNDLLYIDSKADNKQLTIKLNKCQIDSCISDFMHANGTMGLNKLFNAIKMQVKSKVCELMAQDEDKEEEE